MAVGTVRLDDAKDQAKAQQPGLEEVKSRKREALARVENYLESAQWNEAAELCHDLLCESPDDPEIIYWMIRVCADTDKSAIGRVLAKQLVALSPEKWQSWLALGASEGYLQRFPESYKALKRAYRLNPDNVEILRFLANALVMQYDWSGVKYAERSLAIEDHHQAHTVIGFAHLHQRQWAKGWYHYHKQLGYVKGREKADFHIPDWEGEHGKVLVYAEQGLGDQIAYMSAATPHQLTCHPKLKNLFARTFREVHGDQFTPVINWPVTSEYQTSMASAMRFAEMKRRGAYLKPHPEKSLQWRKLLEATTSLPKIGIAWTGGQLGSYGYQGRNLTLDQLLPILKLPYAFVSLEYRDRTDEIKAFEARHKIPIYDWPWGTRTDDYDDTAALVANLDAIVTVPTTAYHLAGALGVPAHVLVHSKPHFHEGVSGECPWWESVKFYRRKELGTKEAIECVAMSLSQ